MEVLVVTSMMDKVVAKEVMRVTVTDMDTDMGMYIINSKCIIIEHISLGSTKPLNEKNQNSI